MKWTKLKIQNFLSISNADMKLDDRGLILIEGINKTNGAFQSNGSGKSSLLDAIVYALYDTTSKGIRADDVVNNVVGKDTMVTLEGEQDGNTYRIDRYRKHTKHKNLVKLYVNDKEVTEKSTRDTNKAIERIIGIDYNTFINSIMFSQGSGAGRFAIATDREKKEILENLVNLSVYATAQDIAKSRVKSKQEEIDQSLRDAEKLQWDLDNVANMEKQDEENYEQTKEMITQEMENVKVGTQQLADYVQAEFSKIDTLKDELENLKASRDNQTQFDMTDMTNSINEEYRVLQQKSNEKSNEEKNKDRFVADYKKLQSDTHCPICGTELDHEHRDKEMENIKSSVRDSMVKIQALQEELGTLDQSYEANLAEYNGVQEQHREIAGKGQEMNQEIQRQEKIITDYDNEVQRMKNANESSQDTLTKLNKVPKPVSRDKERKDIEKSVIAQKRAVLDLEKEKTIIENAVKVYSNTGVKSHVLDLITPYLNERANTYLNKLTGSDIEIEFSTQTQNKSGEMTDKFDIQVRNSTGGATYLANSEGEKKRIDLAISLAIQDLVLSRANMTTNFVVYDEVFDALDAVGSENVIALLRERLETVGSIFVITHSESLKPLFEQVITVTKTGHGESTITEGEENNEIKN